MVMTSPAATGALVSIHGVAPASSVLVPKASSKPVPTSSRVPNGQYGFGIGGHPWLQYKAKSLLAGSQMSTTPLFTLMGVPNASNEILPFIAPFGGGETNVAN